MVYSRVEVWHGVLISIEELETLFESECGPLTAKDRKDKEHELEYYIDMLIMNLDDLPYNVKVKAIGLSHCNGKEPKGILVGILINKFERLGFNIKDVPEDNRELSFIKEKNERNKVLSVAKGGDKIAIYRTADKVCCGKPLSSTDEDRCGDRYRCSQCIGLTVNGNYPVREIYENVKECTSYCFQCNNDKCATSVNHLASPLTIQSFIDEHIVDVLSVTAESEDLSKRLKNYYRLDDCLCCT